jgi:SAM-dependent methyltransferase
VDWGAGHYETTAAQLLPAAATVVDDAGVRAGERALDLGCGTGNAALIAAQRGAIVTGVDPTPRLLDVGRQQARALGLGIDFAVGDAATIPVADASIDLVLSVFGVIFAPDAQAAAQEIARVTAPGGRAVFSAWLPGGPLARAGRERTTAIARATGEDGRPPPFPWHDPVAVGELFGAHGFAVEHRSHELGFTAESPEAFATREFEDDPRWIAGRAALEAAQAREAVERRVTEILRTANEDPRAFRVTSRYLVFTATGA